MDEDTISQRQCRAARAWLGWTQRDLARKAGVDMQTVMFFETGQSVPRRATLLAFMLTFQRMGISWDDEHNNLILPPK
jgi:DNA-binding XRE family transcriptional regulator